VGLQRTWLGRLVVLIFKPWTVLLAVTAFSLSLLGTFLVRSGVLTSVHAFATDPARGVFILMFLAVVVGGSLILYALRAPALTGVGHYEKVSRESAILTNNIILVVATATVLLGTLYPLLVDALGGGKVSVGPPYFDLVFGPVMVPLIILMGFGGLSRWKSDRFKTLLNRLRVSVGLALVAAIGLPFLIVGQWSLGGAVTSALGVWAIASALTILFERMRGARQPFTRLASTPLAIWGMVIAHTGSGAVTVFANGEELTTLRPEKRVYLVNKSPMTEAAL